MKHWWKIKHLQSPRSQPSSRLIQPARWLSGIVTLVHCIQCPVQLITVWLVLETLWTDVTHCPSAIICIRSTSLHDPLQSIQDFVRLGTPKITSSIGVSTWGKNYKLFTSGVFTIRSVHALASWHSNQTRHLKSHHVNRGHVILTTIRF